MSFLNSCQVTSTEGDKTITVNYGSQKNTIEIIITKIGDKSQKVTIDCNEYDGLEMEQLGSFIFEAVSFDPVLFVYEEEGSESEDF